MRRANRLAVGFLSILAATGVVNAPYVFATQTHGADIVEKRIGHGGSTYQSKSVRAGDCNLPGEERIKEDAIEKRIGHGGSTYSFSLQDSAQAGACNLSGEERRKGDLIENRIGHGGSTYSFRSPQSAKGR